MQLYFDNQWNEWPPEGGRFFWPDAPFAQQVQHFLTEWSSGKTHFSIETSGSTGTPKTILLNRKLMVASAEASIEAFQIKEISSVWLALSPFHIGGMMVLVRAILAKQNIVLSEPGNQLSAAIQKNLPQVGFTSLVPSQMFHLLEDEKSRKYLNQMNGLLLGGGPVNSGLLNNILNHLKVPVYQTFGMTETISHFAYRSLNEQEALSHPYRGLPGFKFSISSLGTLQVNGAVTDHNWLDTNDIVELESETSFRWLGRKDHVIISGGKKVHPEQLEQRLKSQLPNHNFFFVGLPHPSWGQSLTLFVEGAEQIELINLVRNYFAGHEKPKQIIFLPSFVYTQTGKINQSESIKNANLSK